MKISSWSPKLEMLQQPTFGLAQSSFWSSEELIFFGGEQGKDTTDVKHTVFGISEHEKRKQNLFFYYFEVLFEIIFISSIRWEKKMSFKLTFVSKWHLFSVFF